MLIIDDSIALTRTNNEPPLEFGYESVVVNKPLHAINSACHHLPDLIPLDVTMPEAVAKRKRF